MRDTGGLRAAVGHAPGEGGVGTWGAIALNARAAQRGVVIVVLASVGRIGAKGGAGEREKGNTDRDTKRTGTIAADSCVHD